MTLRATAILDSFRRALDEGSRFAGATAPNPAVGAAVLDAEGQILSVAAHAGAGRDHAEVAALRIAAQQRPASPPHAMVVTLEPCNHHGRTPPCTDALIGAGVRTIWYGAADPNLAVAGGGAVRLRAAGIETRAIVELDHPGAAELAGEAARLVAPFRMRCTGGRPWVTVKQALTALGSMVPPPGRKTFTSNASLDLAHRLRRRADAIVTGSGCILADDPRFTVRRVPDHPGKRRVLAILDRRRRVPARYLAAAAERGFDVRVETALPAILAELAANGALEVLVEAGPSVTSAVLASGLWDEHVTIRCRARGDSDEVVVRLNESPAGLARA